MRFAVRRFKSIRRPLSWVGDGTFEVGITMGSDIEDAICETIALAGFLRTAVQFVFSGVAITVQADSTPRLIYRDWRDAVGRRIPGTVGPYPIPEE